MFFLCTVLILHILLPLLAQAIRMLGVNNLLVLHFAPLTLVLFEMVRLRSTRPIENDVETWEGVAA
jgi:hypothetical protein